MKNKNVIPVLEKTIQLMEYIAAHNGKVTQSELINALQLPQATCYRIISTLVANNWLAKYGTKYFDISSGLFPVARKALFQLEQYQILQPILRHLAKQVGYSVKFSVLDENEQVNAVAAKAPWDIAVTTTVGSRCLLIDGGSAGVVLASSMPKEDIKLLVKTVKDQTESHLILESLKKKISSFEKQKYCFNPASNDPLYKWHVDALSIAVPCKNQEPPAALTLLGLPGELANANHKELVKEMENTAKICCDLLNNQ